MSCDALIMIVGYINEFGLLSAIKGFEHETQGRSTWRGNLKGGGKKEFVEK